MDQPIQLASWVLLDETGTLHRERRIDVIELAALCRLLSN